MPHLLIFIVKSLIGNTKQIELSADDIPLPGNIYPGAFTTLPCGNIKNLEKTASGETSHWVNDITIQVNFNGPECRQPIPDNNKYKRRSTGPTPQILLVHNAGHIVGHSQT